MANATSKFWGSIDGNGKLIGKLSAFPIKNLEPGERLSYKAIFPAKTDTDPEKYFFREEGVFGKSQCTAMFTPGSPRGYWTISAWGYIDSVVLDLVKKVLESIGLA